MNAPQDPSKVIYEDEFIGPTKELRVLGMVAYFPGGFILPYLLGLSGEPFALFHVKQGFVMFSLMLLIAIFPIGGSSGFAFFLYMVFGSWHAYKAYQGEEYQMGWVKSILGKVKEEMEKPDVPPVVPPTPPVAPPETTNINQK
ncbi:MAG: hypothetical protein PHU93_03705 [Candidatus Gracilibacteria bacterium]|nr:hypothetical protein [Candidatus Gracilibacteria bacterium]